MCKRLFLTLAVVLIAGVLLFPLTAYAEESAEDTIHTAEDESTITGDDFLFTLFGIPLDELEAFLSAYDLTFDDFSDFDFDGDIFGLIDDITESGIPPAGGDSNITPDGTATVVDNVFIEGNGLEFFTFTTEAGNVFYLVIDRSRTANNVYFLNAVNEWDLIALAERGKVVGGNTSTSGIPNTPGGNTEDPPDEPGTPEPPPAKSNNTGMLIFLLLGIAAVGGVAYYFKIVRPKRQPADDDYGGDDEDDYLGDTDEETDPGERD
jgi:hypothetical protein